MRGIRFYHFSQNPFLRRCIFRYCYDISFDNIDNGYNFLWRHIRNRGKLSTDWKQDAYIQNILLKPYIFTPS